MSKKTTRGKLNEDDLLAMYANLERQVSEFQN
jgi:hypothetical protein